AECPLGNDGPSVAAAGLKVGRTRSSACLIVVTSTISPTTTVTRNTGIHLFGTRTYSTIATTTITRMTAYVLARSVTSWSACVERRVPGSSPHCPTLLPHI